MTSATITAEKINPTFPAEIAVKAFKRGRADSHGHQGFTANLYFNGKKVASIENDGWGGMNLYTFNDRATDDAVTAIAKAWAVENGEDAKYALDTLTGALINENLFASDVKRSAKQGRPILLIIDHSGRDYGTGNMFYETVALTIATEEQIAGCLDKYSAERYRVIHAGV